MRMILGRFSAALCAVGLAATLTVVPGIGSAPAAAATLRWSNDGDVNSMDPYARQETFLLFFMQNIYEPLVRRSKDLKLEASLATEWTQTAPDVWRFKLRQGVKFQDGTPFTADDVLFSFQRIRQPTSALNSNVATVQDLVKVDDFTVDFHTKGPDPILPEELTNWGIMSKAWCEKNNASIPADLGKVTQENFATRNAMGTGPYMLKERVPDVRTVLVSNPTWWDKPVGNVTEAVFTRIANPSTRVAALLSGEIDFVYTVPPQDVERISSTQGTKIIKSPELRTIFLGMDQAHDELAESSVKDKNPFKDERVREAFYRAIDEKAIVDKVMRGQAQPTALMVAPGINGFDESLNERPAYDPAKSKKLLADAGYPNGFELGMDCSNDRYVNDEAICQAVAAMLAKVGVKVNLLAQTRLKFFGKIGSPNYASSFYMLGWTPSTYDAHNMLASLVGTPKPGAGIGDNNDGGISNAEIDRDIDAIQVETDQKKRQALISRALGIIKDEYLYIPLHQQVVVWAARSNVDVAQMADNFFPLRFVTVK
ncbi:MAG TPA: ABC transporter substrate-binding protein [Aliidongia sp.]|uniref:ABC transporter substrate-binding protein n=1 Tax=Aliidongia sp. TaxID=1914230 RepID=UPI002DDCFB7A|nr:ABC transporter substrate-binding protein [Aliidongia sp.]HEV2677301.1 ABC transporter substrate-binding protein [Aliidongia sp.]